MNFKIFKNFNLGNHNNTNKLNGSRWILLLFMGRYESVIVPITAQSRRSVLTVYQSSNEFRLIPNKINKLERTSKACFNQARTVNNKELLKAKFQGYLKLKYLDEIYLNHNHIKKSKGETKIIKHQNNHYLVIGVAGNLLCCLKCIYKNKSDTIIVKPKFYTFQKNEVLFIGKQICDSEINKLKLDVLRNFKKSIIKIRS